MREDRGKAIIVDIDGTLANIDHRLRFIKGEKKDWDGFFGNVMDDGINDWCNNLMWYYLHASYRIILVTGRPSGLEQATRDWLHAYGVDYHGLHMRKDGDRRDDSIVKREIYTNALTYFWIA